MADQIRRVDYFYVEVPDKAGEGARVFGKLKEANVNLLSFTAFPAPGGKAQIDLVPKDPDALLRAAKQAGLKLSARKTAFFAEGADRTGVVADLLGMLAGAGINVRAANGCCAQGGGYGIILWVPQEKFEDAAKALGI
jgi:hypothetical protein